LELRARKGAAFMLGKFIYAVKLLIQFFGEDNQSFSVEKGERERVEQTTERGASDENF
jgi:hypothetical protein